MTDIPTPWTVLVHRQDGETRDAHGQTERRFADPTTLDVYGWAPAGSTEPKLVGHDRVIVNLELYTPPAPDVSAYDEISLPDDLGRYQVVGAVEDFTHGPFGYQPGCVINLVEVRG